MNIGIASQIIREAKILQKEVISLRSDFGEEKLTSEDLALLMPEIKNLQNLRSLDLSNNEIVSLPNDFDKLVGVQTLFLSNNGIDDLRELTKLPENLIGLHLDGNLLTSLPYTIGKHRLLQILSIRGNNLISIPKEIGNLHNLESLNLRFNNLIELPSEIWNLQKLDFLDLSENYLITLPKLSKNGTIPSNLRYLSLIDNNFKEFPNEITSLRNLEVIRLNKYSDTTKVNFRISRKAVVNLKHFEARQFASNNQITELPENISQLENLTALHLRDHELKKLPNNITKLTSLKELDVRGNQLSIPPEILEDIYLPQKILNYYFKASKPLNEAKIVVIGEADFGKTLLIRRLVYDDYIDTKSTQGIKIERWKDVKVNHQNVQLNIWDFGGQEIMHSTHQFFFTKRTIYILVINARQNEDKNKTEEWLKRIESFSGDSPVIIVGSKIDQNQRNENQPGQGYFQINQDDLQSKFKNIRGFYGVCSDVRVKGYDDKWSEFKDGLINEIEKLPDLHQSFPLDWFAIKNDLEAMKEKNIPHISNSLYLSNCIQKEVKDEISQDTIREFLNDIGTVIYFKKLFDKMIFNPEWITNGVYALTDNPTVIQNQGVLKYSQLDEILTPRGYKSDEHEFILDLMKEFELCVEIEKRKRFLIPDLLLNVKEPYTGEWKNTLGFQYHYETYLKNIFTKFVVRMYRYIYQKTWWNNGVILAHDESKAYVKFDASGKKVIIRIDGNNIKKRQNLLAIIRKEFSEIHNDFAALEVAEFVAHPTITIKDKDEKVKELLKDYDELLAMEQDGETEVYVKELRTKFPITDWLDGVVAKEVRQMRLEPFIGYRNHLESSVDSQIEIRELQNKLVKLEEEKQVFEKNQAKFDEDAQTISRFKAFSRWFIITLISFAWISIVIYKGWNDMEIWTWVVAIIVGLILTGLACWYLDDQYFPLSPSKIFEKEKTRMYEKHNFNVKECEHIEQELIKTGRKLKLLKE